MPDEGGFDNPPPKDSGLTQKAIGWTKDARNRYVMDEEAYPSPDVRNLNGQIVELVFSELKELDDPKKIEDVQDPAFQKHYADALALLGWESVRKDRVDRTVARAGDTLDPQIAADAIRVGESSDELFLAACDKLFPNLRARAATRTITANLQDVSRLLNETGDFDDDGRADSLGYRAHRTISLARDLDSAKQRVAIQDLTDSLADRMQDAISNKDQEVFPRLPAVPEPKSTTVVTAAKAMYTLKLATPRA